MGGAAAREAGKSGAGEVTQLASASSPAAPPSVPDYDHAFRHLCHLVPLKSGKADEALDDVVLTVLVLAGDPIVTLSDLATTVEVFFELQLEEGRLQGSLDRLLGDGKVTLSGSGAWTVCPNDNATVLERIDAARELEKSVREEWLSSSEVLASDVDGQELWTRLRRYLASVMKSHGMLAIELLDPSVDSAQRDSEQAAEALDEALQGLPSQSAREARCAIEAFFAQKSTKRIRYVSQMLDATFTFYAMSVDSGVDSFLSTDLQGLDLFLDTNTLFGVLGLDSSPNGHAAGELVKFIRGNELPIEVYYHEKTLTEMQNTIHASGARLRSRTWPPSVSRIAIDSRAIGGMRDIERRYHEHNAKTPISVRNFLGKYEHLHDLLLGLGLKLFRQSGIERGTTEQKALRIADYLDYVDRRRPKDPKSYEVADHDISVWGEVESRGTLATRPLEAGALFVTNDLLLRRFAVERSSRRASVVVTPTQLLQVLRPFGRQREEDDAAFVAALCCPEFRTAHAEYAETQREVLGIFTHYKDLEPETAVRILNNDAFLHEAQSLEGDLGAIEKVVDDAIVRENAALLEERDQLRAEIEEQEARHQQATASRDRELRERERQVEALDAELRSTAVAVEQAKSLVEQQELAAERRRSNLEQSARQRAGKAAWVVVSLPAVCALALFILMVTDAGVLEYGILGAFALALGIIAYAVGGWDKVGQAQERIAGRIEKVLLRRSLTRLGEDWVDEAEE